MASQRNTGAFIIGGVLGGMVGAAVTLWNTPKSGEELRAMLTGDQPESASLNAGDVASGQPQAGSRFSNPVLSFVEKAAAPLVGVELGKLARDDPDAARHTPVRESAADARPPAPLSGHTPAQSANEEATHHEDAGSTAHVATTEDLTSPPDDDAANQAASH